MDTTVSCPVCTLYLREGVSLQNHLNTHPKDQVIEALLKYCGPVRDLSAQGEVESVIEAQFENQQNDQTIAETAVPSISTQQQYPCGSSHFTAAVTYQQFMSSNASVGGTVLPQCFSVPAIITTPAGETGQATLMPLLYNPYVIQQQQQQLQFYNAFRSIPQQPLSRQIISPSPLFPVSPQFSVASTGNPIYQTSMSSSSSLQNGENIHSSPTLFVPSVSTEEGTHLKGTDNDQGETSADSGKCKENVQTKQLSKHSRILCNEINGISLEVEESKLKANDEGDCSELPVGFEEDDNLNDVPVEESVKKSSCPSGEFERVVCEEKIVLHNKLIEDDESDSCENETNGISEEALENSVSPGLRVRSDLNKVNSNTSDSYHANKNCTCDNLCDVNVAQDAPSSSTTIDKSLANEGWSFLSQRQKIPPELISEENGENKSSEFIPSNLFVSIAPKSCNSPSVLSIEDEDSARHFKVVDIEGVPVLVASHLISASEEGGAHNSIDKPARTPSQQSICEGIQPDSNEVNTAVNSDIQTDEVMPAMGELSGQESIGENDTNSWSQEKDDLLVQETSYDLLAREKWEVSDASDEENDIDVGDVSVEPVACEVSPSEVSSLTVGSSQSVEEHGVEDKLVTKEKPRCFYKCWTCSQVFTCPKERRVHQSEKHGVRFDKKLENDKSTVWSIVKNENGQPVESAVILEDGERLHIKSERSLLSNIPEEVNENDAESETKPNALDEDPLKDKKDLEEPSKTDVEDAFKFICSRCESVFASAKSLYRHVRTVHGQSQFTCRTCGEKFPTEAAYLAHLKIHPLECSRCGKYFYRHQNLNLHIRRHLGIKPFKCTVCDKAFVTKQKLAEHTNTHTGDTPIKCNMCTETFRRYSNLIQHKNRHHLKIKKKVKDFICHCGEVFHSQKKLRWHKEIHDEKPKTCSYCSERFVHASSLTRHIRKAHDQRYFPCQGRESENVECPICGCVFLKSSLPVHMRLHSGERPYNCHICGKNFSTKWNLQLHRWTHASRSLKPYKCSLCKSAFIRHSEYTSHMHSHRNVRPYTCNFCGSQFIRKYNCIRHAREHESEKPFTCNICQKSFHRRYYLKEHMRIHSGLRPFSCHICGKTSSTKSNHNKHVKIHHAREAVNTEG